MYDTPAYGSRALIGDQFALPYVLEFRPSPEFNYDAGKDKLINLRLFTDGPEVSFIIPGDNDPYDDHGDGTDAGYAGRQGQLLRLSASIDMESRLTIGCAGALLTYMARRKAVEYLPNDVNANNSFCISTIEMFSLGSSTQTPWPLYRYCSWNPTPIHTAKAQQTPPRDLRRVFRYMVSFTILQGLHKANTISGNTFSARVWI